MHPIPIARAVLLACLALFCLIALGLSASLLSNSGQLTFDVGFISFVFAQLSVAVSVLTLVVLIPISVIEVFRKNAFTSMVAVEISWSFVLMVLWAAAAGETTGELSFFDQCNFISDSFDQTQCHIAQGLAGAAWLCFLILMSWHCTLVVFAIIAHSRGNTKVWTSSVIGTNFTAYYAPSMTMDDTYSQQSLIPIQQQQMPMQKQHMPLQQQQYPPYSQGYPPSAYHPTPLPQQYFSAPPGAAQV